MHRSHSSKFVPLVLALTAAPVLAQESSAPFDTPLVVLDMDSPPFQAIADVDGDGDMDAVGARFKLFGAGIDFRVWRNDGLGRLSLAFQNESTLGSASPVKNGVRTETADLDGDGDLDVVVGHLGLYQTYRYLSNGDGTFAPPIAVVASGPLLGLATADFDADGRDDVATVTNAAGFPMLHMASVAWGGGGNTSVVYPSHSGILGDQLVTMEGDGDPLPDLLAGNAVDAHVITFTGRTLSWSALPSPGTFNQGLMWTGGDIDADGDSDVVAFAMGTSGANPNHVVVYRRVGSSTWTKEPEYTGGPAQFLFDIDADGDLDGVCCGGGGGPTPYYPKLDFVSQFEVALNTGGVFAVAESMQGLGSEELAGICDLDADGDYDLVAGACVYYGRGSWKHTPTLPGGYWLDGAHHMLNDRDGDGDIDIQATEWGGRINQGDGTTVTLNVPGVPAPPGTVLTGPSFIGDFSGDGLNDELLLHATPSPQGPQPISMALVRNKGGGEFELAGPATALGVSMLLGAFNYTAWNHVVADADGDGDNDLFVRTVDPNSKQSRMWINDGSGYFTAGDLFPTERVEACADLDGDGLGDLVTTSFEPGKWIVNVRLHGNGGHSHYGGAQQVNPFGPFPPPTPDDGPTTFDVADYNDDGLADIAYLDALGRPVLYFNTSLPGSPSFAYSGVFGALVLAQKGAAIGAHDVNGDGWTDVVLAAPTALPGCSLLALRKRGTTGVLGANSYEPTVVQVIPNRWPADLDGDGDVELCGSAGCVRGAAFLAPADGLRKQYGAGSPGTGGLVPLLGAQGPFRIGESPQLRVTNARGGTLGVLAFSLASSHLSDLPFVGMTTLIDPYGPLFLLTLPIQGAAGAAGVGKGVVPVNVNAGLVGPGWFHQVFVFDPAAPSLFAASNGLELRYGS